MLLVGGITRPLEKLSQPSLKQTKYPELLQSLIDVRLRNLCGSWPVKLELMNIFVKSACACTRAGSFHFLYTLCLTYIKISKTEIVCLFPAMKSSAVLCKCNVVCFYLCPKRTPLSCWSRISLFCFVLLAA